MGLGMPFSKKGRCAVGVKCTDANTKTEMITEMYSNSR